MTQPRNFTVQSDDPVLLNAFEEKLKANGVKCRKSTAPYVEGYITVIPNNVTNEVYYTNTLLTPVTICYSLPTQWDDAVNEMMKIKKPSYEENDWVVLKGGSVIRLVKKINTKDDIWMATGIYAGGIHEREIERKATREELYVHLLNNIDIQIGDSVEVHNLKVNDTVELNNVTGLRLYSDAPYPQANSKICHGYYKKHGDHMVVVAKYGAIIFPADYCKKLDRVSFDIETNKDSYTPKYNQSHNGFDIGCVKQIKQHHLYSLLDIMNFCKMHNVNLTIDHKDRIKEFKMRGRQCDRTTPHNVVNGRHMTEEITHPITSEMINELKEYLVRKENENKSK